MGLGILLVLMLVVFAVLCLAGAVLSMFLLRPIIALMLFLGFVLFLIGAFGVGFLTILWRELPKVAI